MHDELEGNVRLHVSLLLREFKTEKTVTLDGVNEMIAAVQLHRVASAASC